jgi:hypothetical protein
MTSSASQPALPAALARLCCQATALGGGRAATEAHPSPDPLPSGYVQPSPWLNIANKQLGIMHKYLGELGLSPVSRSRVHKLPSLGPKPWEDDWEAAG